MDKKDCKNCINCEKQELIDGKFVHVCLVANFIIINTIFAGYCDGYEGD